MEGDRGGNLSASEDENEIIVEIGELAEVLELLPNPRLIGARRNLLLQKEADLSQTLLLRLPRVRRRRRRHSPPIAAVCVRAREPQKEREREREMERKESVKTTAGVFSFLKVD